jgi:hypothetical protein
MRAFIPYAHGLNYYSDGAAYFSKLFVLAVEADHAFGTGRVGQHGFEEILDCFVATGHTGFEFGKFSCQLFIRNHQFAQPDKDPDRCNIYLNRAFAAQNR